MPQMHKFGESKKTQIMMATVPHITSGSGLRKFQANGFLFDRPVRDLENFRPMDFCSTECTKCAHMLIKK